LKRIKENNPRYEILLQGKIYLLQTQIEKKRILISQYKQLIKYQMKNFKKEFEKLKNSCFKMYKEDSNATCQHFRSVTNEYGNDLLFCQCNEINLKRGNK